MSPTVWILLTILGRLDNWIVFHLHYLVFCGIENEHIHELGIPLFFGYHGNPYCRYPLVCLVVSQPWNLDDSPESHSRLPTSGIFPQAIEVHGRIETAGQFQHCGGENGSSSWVFHWWGLPKIRIPHILKFLIQTWNHYGIHYGTLKPCFKWAAPCEETSTLKQKGNSC